MDTEQKFDDLAFMRDSRKWTGDTCCVKKQAKAGEAAGFMCCSAFGVILSGTEPVTIYLRGDDEHRDFEREVRYDTLEAAIADGWVVD